MSWHFSRALVEAYSEENSSAGKLCAPLSGSPIPQAFLSPDRMKAFFRLSRFGMTCEPLTEIRGEELLTLYRADFHAKTYPQQDEAQESKESEVECGDIWHESLARYDRATHSWKTLQCSLLEGLDEFSETWPKWGMRRDGQCWEQQTLEQITGGIEYGSSENLPTVVKSDHAARRPSKGWAGNDLPSTLWKINGGLENPQKPPLKLNARYAEWMMGWPQGWTKLVPLETDKFQQWQHSHGIY